MTQPLLVTGAAGFVGARFIESCNRLAIPVISVDHPGYFKTRTENASVNYGKILDRETFLSTLEKKSLDVSAIIHMGACTDTTEMDVAYLNKMNLEYSKFLWLYASEKKIPFYYASSAATYGEGELGYDDDENQFAKLKPLNPYGESKLQFDLWALDQEKKGIHPPSWAGFKFFNVYGFGERHKESMASVIVHAFDLIQKTGQAKLFKSHRAGIADGEQKRDFVSVDDVVDVLHFARTKPLNRGVYNLGTGQARTFHDLVKAVFASLGLPENILFIDTPIHLRERYQYFTQAEMGRLRAQGYTKPFTSLEDGVRNYIKRLKS